MAGGWLQAMLWHRDPFDDARAGLAVDAGGGPDPAPLPAQAVAADLHVPHAGRVDDGPAHLVVTWNRDGSAYFVGCWLTYLKGGEIRLGDCSQDRGIASPVAVPVVGVVAAAWWRRSATRPPRTRSAWRATADPRWQWVRSIPGRSTPVP